MEKERDKFELSDGNLKVLELVPKMMKNIKYRKELRRLALRFIMESNTKVKSGTWGIN